MKATISFVLMATTLAMAFGGALLNEKEDAKKAITDKHLKAKDLITQINDLITTEKGKREEALEQQTRSALENKVNETVEKFTQNVKESSGTAIAKGKPIQAIECIVTVFFEGGKMIQDLKKILTNEIDSVLRVKSNQLDFLGIESKFVSEGLEDLIQQALNKIDSLKNGFELVKVDAFKKIESAKKQLSEIEVQISAPPLAPKYGALKKQIESKYQDTAGILFKKLQKCVA